jgi:phosphoribosylformylglycinamidine cyclo-ligase
VSGSLGYRDAGVNLGAAADAKARIGRLVESTWTSGARGRFGGFGGLFRMPSDVQSPLLVSSADGVGTKLKVAIAAGRHNTVGHDLVNHCVNDILVQGARPLFFLDYVAFGVLEPEVAEAIVAGVAAGCRENQCSLMGGETAELPGLYTPPDYDLAGFIVGVVAEDRLLGADRVCAGDALVALASSGLHTNGYSLARRILFDQVGLDVTDRFPGGDDLVADVLLRVHRSYLSALAPVLDRVHAMAHITGGGLPGNVDRVLPDTLDAEIRSRTWTVPDVFQVLEERGGVGRDEMFRVFNMGVGMVVIATAADAASIVEGASRAGIEAWTLGSVVPGTGRVRIT